MESFFVALKGVDELSDKPTSLYGRAELAKTECDSLATGLCKLGVAAASHNGELWAVEQDVQLLKGCIAAARR